MSRGIWKHFLLQYILKPGQVLSERGHWVEGREACIPRAEKDQTNAINNGRGHYGAGGPREELRERGHENHCRTDDPWPG